GGERVPGREGRLPRGGVVLQEALEALIELPSERLLLVGGLGLLLVEPALDRLVVGERLLGVVGERGRGDDERGRGEDGEVTAHALLPETFYTSREGGLFFTRASAQGPLELGVVDERAAHEVGVAPRHAERGRAGEAVLPREGEAARGLEHERHVPRVALVLGEREGELSELGGDGACARVSELVADDEVLALRGDEADLVVLE